MSSDRPAVISDLAELREWIRWQRREGGRVGLVPTMGALHAGHLSLVQAAKRDCDVVLTTIFVNPTQFAPHEDLARYPRDLERDCQRLATVDCDVVLVPSAEAMYPTGYQTRVDVGAVAKPWEGAVRPGHFQGVATVVLKLFNLAPADRAYFGQKDYQQTVVVRRMVADLNVPIEVVVCPTVREDDGLAMSSRNAYLTPQQRPAALSLWRSLCLAEELVASGERSCVKILGEMRQRMTDAGAEVQYAAALKPGTVDEVAQVTGPTVFAVAAQVGQTRLIDNAMIG